MYNIYIYIFNNRIPSGTFHQGDFPHWLLMHRHHRGACEQEKGFRPWGLEVPPALLSPADLDIFG